MTKETVQVVDYRPTEPTPGSAGLKTQLPGTATTVGSVSAATGDIGRGKLIEKDSK